jgi:hypothetical protein
MTEEEKKIKRREAVRRYRLRHPERVKELAKKNRNRPEAKEKHRLKQAQWRKENPEKQKEVARRSYAKNKDKFNEKAKIKYHTDLDYKEKKLLIDKKYRLSGRRRELYHSDPNKSQRLKGLWLKMKVNESANTKRLTYLKKYREEVLIKKERKQRENLSDIYVIAVIKRQFNYKIKTSEIPKELIELKKNNIKIKRETKKVTL